MLVAEKGGDSQAAARKLDRDLNSGKWRISSDTYGALSQEVRRILRDASAEAHPQAAMAEAVKSVWDRWRREPAGTNRQSLSTSAGPVLIVWRSAAGAAAVFVANTDYLDWLPKVQRELDERGVRMVLTQPDGRPVFGNSSGMVGRPATRLANAVAGLPWTMQTFNTGNDDQLDHRRLLLGAGFAILLALILMGSWFIGHAVARELAVARLQSDFVSAVSHEFRTPLTTLCALTEMLKRGRVPDGVDRAEFYELMYHDSDRLRRLVESLLNFGRLESGRLQFRFESLDAADLVRESAAEFSEAREAEGFRFEVAADEASAAGTKIRADRETLRCVLWNLYENAVKYSPGCDTVWVNLARNNGHVEIAVRDQGVGIPRAEHQRIFEKFVRGSAERDSDIRGTGIGLAFAQQIVRAHGGDITLESEPGKGSTFRVALPTAEAENDRSRDGHR
jgi:signal transduction histidine kinase